MLFLTVTPPEPFDDDDGDAAVTEEELEVVVFDVDGSGVVEGVVECVVVVDVVEVVDVVVVVDVVDVVDVDKDSRNTAALMCVAELVVVTQAPAGAAPSAQAYIPSLIPSHTSEAGMLTPSSL